MMFNPDNSLVSDDSLFRSNIILVVDDETAIVQTMVLVLNHSGHNLFAVGSTNIDEALSIVRGIRPDLVLLDVMMPGVDGLQHALAMRDQFGCDVLLMSGHATTQAVIEESLAAGNQPFDIVAKPIHPTLLLTAIHEILQRAAARPGRPNPINFYARGSGQ